MKRESKGVVKNGNGKAVAIMAEAKVVGESKLDKINKPKASAEKAKAKVAVAVEPKGESKVAETKGAEKGPEKKAANGGGRRGLNAQLRTWIAKGWKEETIIHEGTKALLATRKGKTEQWATKRIKSKIKYVQKAA